MSVPTNLIPSPITGLQEYTGSSTLGYLPYVLEGRSYKVQFANIAAVGAVPSSRVIAAGTGLAGGGDLTTNRVISIANGGVGFDQLALSGVTQGTYGSGSAIPILTVDAKGRVTSATTAPLDVTGFVPTSRTITAGDGLTGGGSLANNISLAANFSAATPSALGTASAGTAITVSRGDHVHPAVNLSDTSQTQGALPLGRGGTGDALSPVAGAVVYSTGTKFALTNPGIAGQVLVSGGTDEPQWRTVEGGGTVTSVNASGGTTGLSFAGGPITVSGTLTLGGTLAVASGGTGATTAAAARTNLGATTIGGNVFTLTNPSAITFPRFNADNTVSALDAATFRTAIGAGTGAGSVTSVSGTGTVSGLSLSGTVTTAGSLTLGGTLAVTPSNFSSQTANTFLAAPNGAAGVPTFRNIVAADVPTLNQNTTGTASNVTGIVAVANGGTGASTAGTARTNLGAAASGANTDITSIALTTGTISATPTNGTDIVNKVYADSIASGINFHQSVRLATAAALPANTYNNGTSGVGATLTGTANGALTVDGVAAVAGNRILVKNEAAGANNGVYTVTQVGSAGTPYILTRATDFDSAGTGVDQIDAGDFFLVTAGSTQSNTSWVQQTPLPITVGTTALVFTQFAAPVLYSAGTGLTLAGTVFSLTAPVTVALGGTGATSLSSGYLVKGNGTSAVSASVVYDTGTNVGIGTASPGFKLQVEGTIRANSGDVQAYQGALSTYGVAGTAAVKLFQNSGNWEINNPGGYLQFYDATAAAERMRITSAGNVGIGTASPRAVTNYTNIGINGTSGSFIDFFTGGTRYGTIFGTSASLDVGTPTATPLTLTTNATERMRITSAGNVGIGTSAPATRLHLEGADTELRVQSTTSTNGYIRFLNTSGSMSIGMSGGPTNTLLTYDRTNSQTVHEYLGGASGYHYWATNGTERMRIDSAGQVGIGAAAANGTTLRIGKNLTGAVNSLGVYNNQAIQSDVTTSAQLFSTYASTAAAAFTLSSLTHFNAGLNTIGAGSAVTTQIGFFAQSTLVGATNNYGFYGGIPDATGRWNFYAGGTAPNYFAGNVGIGTSAPAARLHVVNSTVNAQFRLQDVTTDATNKYGVVGTGHYTNAQSPILAVGVGSLSASNTVYVGGGFGSLNAATAIQFFTAANNTTLTGTERMRIDSSGNVGIGVAPSCKFQVVGAAARLLVDFSGDNYYDAATHYFRNFATTATSYISVGTASTLFSTNTTLPLTLGTNNTERMRVDSAGNVGIGTSAPITRLHVSQSNAGDYASVVLLSNSADAAADRTGIYGSPASGTANPYRGGITFHPGATGAVSIHTGNNTTPGAGERMRIDGTGNVGIGTATPSARLSVQGSISFGNPTGSPAATLSGILSEDRSFSVSAANAAPVYLTSTQGPVSANLRDVGLAGSSVIFGTGATSGTSFSERMRIDSTGNVGIGTSSPSFRLQVETDTDANAGAFIRNSNTGTAASGNLTVASLVGNIFIRAHSAANSVWPNSTLISSDSGFTGGLNIAQAGANPIRLWTNGSERMRITSAGNVGIGTGTPAQRLDVTGSENSVQARFGSVPGRGLTIGTAVVTGTNDAGVVFNAPTTEGTFIFQTVSAERMRIDSSGRVMVGSTANAFGSKMEIVTSGSNNLLSLVNTTADGGAKILFVDGSNNAAVGNLGGNLLFYANGASSERMRLTSAGNFGINTTTPGVRLDVVGSIRASQSVSIGSDGTYEGGSIYSDANWGMLFRAKQPSPTQAQYRWATSADVELMRIDPSGRMMVGRTSALNNGTIEALGTSRQAFVGQVTNNANSVFQGFNAAGTATFYATGAGDVFLNSITALGTGPLIFYVNSAERMRIASDGNVTIAAKIVPNVQSVASASTITPNANTDTQVSVTALAVAATIAAPSGTPSDGQSLVIRIEDNGTARALTWTTGSSGAYRPVGITLPTTTVATKMLYVGFKYNSTDLRWDAIALSQEA